MAGTRAEALELFLAHNKEESLLKHALSIEAAMRHFARRHGEDEERWGLVGLLHDIDWEETQHNPKRHTARAVDILNAAGYDPVFVRAVRSHGWGLCHEETMPESLMEKTLFAVDELAGFVTAVALVRPSRSLQDLEPKSVKKKWKDKAFARGVDRSVIEKGAELLGEPLDVLIVEVIEALKPVEREIGLGETN